jgi:DNA-directed RNA polymerase III subunit RPC1
VDNIINSKSFQNLLPQGHLFLEETKRFFDNYADSLEKLENIETASIDVMSHNDNGSMMEESIIDLRSRIRSLSKEEKTRWVEESRISGSDANKEAHRILRDNVMRLTHSQMNLIFEKALNKYHLSMIEPGEAVGAVGAQSLSEPGTQVGQSALSF